MIHFFIYLFAFFFFIFFPTFADTAAPPGGPPLGKRLCPVELSSVSIVTPHHTQTHKHTHTNRNAPVHPRMHDRPGQLSDVKRLRVTLLPVLKWVIYPSTGFITPCKGKHYLSLPRPPQDGGRDEMYSR